MSTPTKNEVKQVQIDVQPSSPTRRSRTAISVPNMSNTSGMAGIGITFEKELRDGATWPTVKRGGGETEGKESR